MARKNKKIEIFHEKLGRQKVSGLAYTEDNKIVIEERLFGKEYFATAIHESLHMALPELSEKKVVHAEKVIINILWDMGFRYVDVKE